MRYFYSTAGLLIFGLAVPLFTQINTPTTATTASANSLDGSFANSEWIVHVYYINGVYRYDGHRRGTDESLSIHLSGAVVSGDRQKKVYTWNNSGTKYQVTWNRQDPDYIRVRVINPRGREILNRLLSRCEQGC
jgi:hypothetical protein